MYLAVHIPMYLNCYVMYLQKEDNMSLEYIYTVCIAVYWHMFVFNMSAVYYMGMKQVIYSVHSCMVSLVYIWLCSPQ